MINKKRRQKMNGLKLECNNMMNDLMEEIINKIDGLKLVDNADKFYALFYILDFLKDRRELVNSVCNDEWTVIRKAVLDGDE